MRAFARLLTDLPACTAALLPVFAAVTSASTASPAAFFASFATWKAVAPDGRSAQGLSNQTSFLRPIVSGTIHATARRRHRGHTTWVWEVDITDDEGRVCALVRMTVAVRG